MTMKKCWVCGADNADYSFDVDIWRPDDELSDKVLERERLKRKDINSNNDVSMRCFCKECYHRHIEAINRQRNEYVLLKKKLMLERAVRCLEKQAVDIYKYKDIISDMEEYIEENPNKFDSSHEMIAAIILIDNEIKSKMQYKVGNYRVDFLIPEYKIVLEIDGGLHKNTLYHDNQRDIELRKILGMDWEVVRIGTQYIEQNARALIDAMFAVKEEKQKLRKSNYGALPSWYSKRNSSVKKRAPSVGDDRLLL